MLVSVPQSQKATAFPWKRHFVKIFNNKGINLQRCIAAIGGKKAKKQRRGKCSEKVKGVNLREKQALVYSLRFKVLQLFK